MTDEFDAPTRAEIKAKLEETRNLPGNRGLQTAALRVKQEQALNAFLQGRGLGKREIERISSDIASYYPQNYSAVGRQV